MDIGITIVPCDPAIVGIFGRIVPRITRMLAPQDLRVRRACRRSIHRRMCFRRWNGGDYTRQWLVRLRGEKGDLPGGRGRGSCDRPLALRGVGAGEPLRRAAVRTRRAAGGRAVTARDNRLDRLSMSLRRRARLPSSRPSSDCGRPPSPRRAPGQPRRSGRPVRSSCSRPIRLLPGSR
jgi:hypothetical protein